MEYDLYDKIELLDRFDFCGLVFDEVTDRLVIRYHKCNLFGNMVQLQLNCGLKCFVFYIRCNNILEEYANKITDGVRSIVNKLGFEGDFPYVYCPQNDADAERFVKSVLDLVHSLFN